MKYRLGRLDNVNNWNDRKKYATQLYGNLLYRTQTLNDVSQLVSIDLLMAYSLRNNESYVYDIHYAYKRMHINYFTENVEWAVNELKEHTFPVRIAIKVVLKSAVVKHHPCR